MYDSERMFWETKFGEQLDEKLKENIALTDKIKDDASDFEVIYLLKKFFINSNGNYHSVLTTWKEELDIIFNIAEGKIKNK